MSQVDIDDIDKNERMIAMDALIYAVDHDGICHLLENQTLNDSDQLNHADSIQNSAKFYSVGYLSTQPFSILHLEENNFSTLRLFNSEISTPVLSPPAQLSGHLASQYQNVTLVNTNEMISKTIKKKTKKKKKLRSHSHRFSVLKKQLKAYFQKKKQRRQRDRCPMNPTSNILVHPQSEPIDPSPIDPSTMIDFQLAPDLSKRKYIYKDVTLSNNNSNQMNWRIFQCTQQSSCFDQTMTNDRNCHRFLCPNNFVSLPDIRIGLSRHHSIKQLHRTIID